MQSRCAHKQLNIVKKRQAKDSKAQGDLPHQLHADKYEIDYQYKENRYG